MLYSKIINRTGVNLFAVFMLTLLVACGEDPVDNRGNGGGSDNPDSGDGYEDIKVVDGKVRFYLEEKENAIRTAGNIKERNWSTTRVLVDGKTYNIEFTNDETPRPYIEVAASSTESYNATLLASGASQWYSSSVYNNIRLIHSQIYHLSESHIRSYPMYASYSKQNGNRLIFNDGFAMISLKLKGSDKISSVKVEEPTGKPLTGFANYMPSKAMFTISKGVNYAVLNCTNRGEFVQLDQSAERIMRLIIAPGSYPEGLKFSICDSKRGAMFFTTEPLTLEAGEVYTIKKEYACEPDLAFYEAFDNFVWGGDIMKGERGFGFSPSDEEVSKDSSQALTGYELATYEVSYDNPGTGFVQSNSWNVVSGKSVGESHQMSDSYVASRNIANMGYMFRVQEHPGYIAIGTATEDRGIFQTSLFEGFKTISKAKITIDMAMQAGFNGELLLQLINGGVIQSATLNGKPLELTTDNLYYRFETASCKLAKETLVIPSSQAESKEWNRLELFVNGVTDGSKLYLADNISTKGVHGIYVDRIEVREIEEWGKKEGTVRILLWNVLAGLWCEQHNNYDNFVEWVKKYDPDICIWCESESIYTDDPNPVAISKESDKYLPNGWAELGARFGQPYAAVSGNRDNYPQTVTSKFPITTVQRITDTDDEGLYGKKFVLHGAGHYQINLSGKTLNIVTCHMHPMTYAPSTPSAGQAASTAAHEGDYFREYEMKYIVKKTVNHSSYAGEQYWLLAGDTNSHSPLDAWYYGYAEDAPELLTHNVIRKNTNLKDVIGDRYPANHFLETYPTHNRIDFIYLSPAMFDYVDNSIVLIDEWCRPRKNGNSKNWYAPADHRPILLDLVIK